MKLKKKKGCFGLKISYTELEQKLLDFYFVKLHNVEKINKVKVRTDLGYHIKLSKTKIFEFLDYVSFFKHPAVPKT